MEGVWSEIVTKEMGFLAGGIVALMLFVGRIPMKGGKCKLNETKWWKDWGIFIMLALCVGGSFMPGIHKIPYSEWGGILVFAFTTGMVTLTGRALLKRFGLFVPLEGKK